MSFEDLNQFHSFYFAEVINFKREQSGIVIVVELRDSGERERERERKRERERERNMRIDFHGSALMSELLDFLEKQSVGLPAPMGTSLL